MLTLFLALLATGCTGTSEQRKVRGDFQKEHPDYQIISIGDADGNDTTVVSFFIRYKKPGDQREYWSDWAYDRKDGKFVLVGKGPESLFEPTARP